MECLRASHITLRIEPSYTIGSHGQSKSHGLAVGALIRSAEQLRTEDRELGLNAVPNALQGGNRMHFSIRIIV